MSMEPLQCNRSTDAGGATRAAGTDAVHFTGYTEVTYQTGKYCTVMCIALLYTWTILRILRLND